VVRQVRTQELEAKMRAKHKCYTRYRSYIENEIQIDFVAHIKHDWVTNILDLIPH